MRYQAALRSDRGRERSVRYRSVRSIARNGQGSNARSSSSSSERLAPERRAAVRPRFSPDVRAAARGTADSGQPGIGSSGSGRRARSASAAARSSGRRRDVVRQPAAAFAQQPLHALDRVPLDIEQIGDAAKQLRYRRAGSSAGRRRASAA